MHPLSASWVLFALQQIVQLHMFWMKNVFEIDKTKYLLIEMTSYL